MVQSAESARQQSTIMYIYKIHFKLEGNLYTEGRRKITLQMCNMTYDINPLSLETLSK